MAAQRTLKVREVSCRTVRAEAQRGRRIGERYILQRKIGSGGYSDVWESRDALTGMTVAIKLFNFQGATATSDFLAELSILRMHRLPGIVEIFDEGTSDGVPFLVMELIRGKHFPGKRGRRTWQEIEPTVIALLEALGRLHVEGVIHQDLKPANVLVIADRRPVILDFGISHDEKLFSEAEDRTIAGTFPYVAPERLDGTLLPSPSIDLYAVGVLLFSALSGRLPHLAPRTTREWRAQVRTIAAPPLRSISPSVPPLVAAVVDQLLIADPVRRPASASAVLSMLRDQPQSSATRFHSLSFDGGSAIRDIMSHIRAGRSVDLVGPQHSGRSSRLREVHRLLEACGFDVIHLTPAGSPLTRLARAVAPPERREVGPPRDAAASALRSLNARLRTGLVLLIDDLELFDERTAKLLHRCRSAGIIVRAMTVASRSAPARTATVRLNPLPSRAFHALFEGPERLFHLRTDAAKVLHERSGGLAGRAALELEAWIRAGLATWDAGKVAIGVHSLEKLKAQRRGAAPEYAAAPHDQAEAPEALRALLECVLLASPRATPRLLSVCATGRASELEADLRELVRLGLVSRTRRGGIVPTPLARLSYPPPLHRRMEIHGVLAKHLRRGDPERFRHALLAQRDLTSEYAPVIAEEAHVTAARLAVRGDLRGAARVLQDGLLAIRRAARSSFGAPSSAEESLLATWVDVALTDGTTPVLALVRYELARARIRSDIIVRLDAVAHAAIAYSAGGNRALEELQRLPQFEDITLERRRMGLLVLAARRCDMTIEAAVFADVARWARCQKDVTTRARFAFWKGWFLYRRGRFEEAARWHLRAAALDPWRTARASARIAAASALLEAFRHSEAAQQAQLALYQTRRAGSPYIEARAEWALRSALYRMGQQRAPDLDLVRAVRRLSARDIEATLCLTEAAFAYRGGEHAIARDLAQAAHALWTVVHNTWPADLARALALRAGAAPERAGEMDEIAARAQTCPTRGIGIQVLGLLGPLLSKPVPRAAMERLSDGIAPRHFGLRMDVLSVAECLAGGAAPHGAVQASRAAGDRQR